MPLARPLLVGESNPYSVDPRCALLPWPARAAGGRLARILGLSDREYLRAFDRRNLVVGARWSAPRARAAADLILLERRPLLVLLGRRVAAMFGFRDLPFFSDVPPSPPFLPRAILLPHPSGLCHEWNDPVAARRARDLLAPYLRY